MLKPEQNNRTTRTGKQTGQTEQDCQQSTDRRGKTEQNSQKKKIRTGQPEWDKQNGTGR
jgi:hypothetical protein